MLVSKQQGLEHSASTISRTLACNGFFVGTLRAFRLSSFKTNTARLNRFGNIGPILVFVVRSCTASSFGFFLRLSIAGINMNFKNKGYKDSRFVAKSFPNSCENFHKLCTQNFK